MYRIAIPVLSYRPDNYIRVLKNLGAEPITLDVFESAEHFDGLLLPGGGCDVNPERYGQPNLCSRNVNDAEDDLQIKMLEHFIKSGKPVLGVCRGMQLINVFFGGSLIQNIDEVDTHNGDGSADSVHGSFADHGSWLELLYGERFRINSHHHQAVDRPGEGICLDQFAEDGIPEGFYHRQYPIWAVQWHPERCGPGNDLADGRFVYRFFLDRMMQVVQGQGAGCLRSDSWLKGEKILK